MNWAEIDKNLTDPAWYTSTEYLDVYKKLRDEDPIHHASGEHYGRPYWYISRYEHVKEILFNPAQFSNRMQGSRIPRTSKRLTPEQKHNQGWDVAVNSTDGATHALYRRPMNKHFSVPAIARLADDVDGYVDDLIREVCERDEFDLVADVTAELPVRVVLRLLGVPEEDWAELKTAAHMWGTPSDPRFIIDGDPVKTANEGLKRIGDYSVELAENRRRNPTDDLATIVGNLEADGEKLTVHEMRTWFFTLIAGGLETTRSAASVGIWAFLQNPDQRALLMEDPSLANAAAEEVLRWGASAKHVMRVATDNAEVGGQRIASGDWVFLSLASANKDERAFDDPYRFDITRRSENEHLGLGDGIHKCLGRSLVRLELALLLPKFLASFPDLEIVDPGEPKWVRDTQATGFTEMKMRHNGKVIPPA